MALEKWILVMTHLPSFSQFQGIFPCGFQSSLYLPDFYSSHSLRQFQVRFFSLRFCRIFQIKLWQVTEYSLYLLFHCIFVRLANVNELFLAFEKEMEKEEKVASWGF